MRCFHGRRITGTVMRRVVRSRAMIRSVASLNYAEVQQARDGTPNETCAPLMDEVITPLYAAYDALTKARAWVEREMRARAAARVAKVRPTREAAP